MSNVAGQPSAAGKADSKDVKKPADKKNEIEDDIEEDYDDGFEDEFDKDEASLTISKTDQALPKIGSDTSKTTQAQI